MTLRRLTALALMTGLLCASTAFAQTEEDPEPEVSVPGPYSRMLAVAVNGGADTPFGVVGASVEFAPIEYLNIYAGGGVSRSGARVAGGVELRFPVHSTSFGFRGGVAGGPMNWNSNGSRDGNVTVERYWEFALFMHLGLTIEYRFDEGLFIRGMVGMEGLVAGDTTSCASSDGTSCDPTRTDLFSPIRGWAGLAVGYAFEL